MSAPGETERSARWAATMAGYAGPAPPGARRLARPHRPGRRVAPRHARAPGGTERAARARGARGRAARAGSHPLVGRRPAGETRAAGSLAHLLRARPRPHPPRDRLPAPGRQDAGLRVPPGPPADEADARARGGAGGHGHRAGLPAERAPDRGHRTRPRLRARPRGARQRGRARPLRARGVRPRALGSPRLPGAAQPVRRDGGRDRQPQLVPAGPVDPRGRGGQLGRPDRLRVPRLGGRRPGRHRGAAPVAHRRALAVRRAAQRPARRLHRRGGLGLAAHRPGGHGGGGSRGARGVPGLQLRAHLPARRVVAPGRCGHRRPARARRALRGPTAPRHRARPDRTGGGRRGARGVRRRCWPPSPTWRA